MRWGWRPGPEAGRPGRPDGRGDPGRAAGCREWPLAVSRFLGRRAKGKAADRARPVRWLAKTTSSRTPVDSRLSPWPGCTESLQLAGCPGQDGRPGEGTVSAQVPPNEWGGKRAEDRALD